MASRSFDDLYNDYKKRQNDSDSLSFDTLYADYAANRRVTPVGEFKSNLKPYSNKSAMDAVDLVKQRMNEKNQEDLNSLPEGAFDYVEANKKESKLNNVIYNLTKNNPTFETVNAIADMKRSNVSETLQSKYGMDKETADKYENNWNSISESKKANDFEVKKQDALKNIDEDQYNLLQQIGWSNEVLKHPHKWEATAPKQAKQYLSENTEKLKSIYGMTDEQIKEYTEYVSQDYNKKKYENEQQKMQDLVEKHPVVGKAALSGLSFATNFTGGFDAAVSTFENRNSDTPIDPYSKGYEGVNTSNLAKSTVEANIDSWLGKKIYLAAQSSAESLSYILTGGAVAEGLGLTGKAASTVAKIVSYKMFSESAFGSSFIDKKQQGLSDRQAIAYGISAGAAEAISEEIGFDNMFKVVSGKVGFKEFMNLLKKNAISEGLEEIASDAMNTIADKVINGDYSDYEMEVYSLMKDNPDMTEDEARKIATKNLFVGYLEDGFVGALSGLMFTGAGSAVNQVGFHNMAKNASDETVKNAADAAMKSDTAKGSTAREIAQKLADNNQTVDDLSTREKAQLFESLSQLQEEEIDNSINTALESRIENEDTLNKAKELFTEYRTTNMSDAQFEEKLVNEVAKNSEERNAILEARNEALTVNEESNPITNTLNAAQIDKQINIQNKAIQKEIEKQDKLANKQYAKFEKAVSSKEKYAAAKGVAAVTVKEGKEETSSKVLKLATIKGSQNTKVVLEGGKTALLKDITFNDQNLGKLYNGLSSSIGNVNVANKALENYKGQEVESYIDAFRVVYNLGRESVRTNKDASWLLDNKLDSYIVYDMGGSQIAAEIFYLGKNDATEYKNTKEAVYGKPENVSYKNRSNADDLIKTESDLKNFLALLSDKTEAKIEMSSYLKDNNGNYVQAVVAAFADNIIYFTDAQDNNALQSVLHESMEKMRKANIEGYNLIVSEVLQYVQETKGSKYLIDVIQKYQRAYTQVEGYSPVEEVSEEYTNDFVAGILTSEEGLRDLAKWSTTNNSEKAKTLFENIKELFDLILNELRSYMNKNKHTMQQGARDGFEATGKRIEALRNTVLSELNKMGTNSVEKGIAQATDNLSDEEVISNIKKNYSINVNNDLIAVHNLTDNELIWVLKLGGFPSPSIAIIRTGMGHSVYGDVSVLFNRDTIDPKLNKKNKVYGGDAYTPTFSIEYKPNYEVIQNVKTKLHNIAPDIDKFDYIGLDVSSIEDALNSEQGKISEKYYNRDGLKYAYLKSLDSNYEIPYMNIEYSTEHSDEALKAFIDNLGESNVYKYENMKPLAKEIRNDHQIGYDIMDAINKYYQDKFDGFTYFEKDELNLDYFGDASKLSGLIHSAWRMLKNDNSHQRIDTAKFREDFDSKTNISDFKKWIENLFDGVIEKQGIRNNKDAITNNGRRSWEQLHDEVTLDNIVKAMFKKGAKAIDSGFDDPRALIMANSTKDFNSIDDIKNSKKQLMRMSEKEYQDRKDYLYNELNSIATEIQSQSQIGSWTDALEAIADALQYKTLNKIQESLKNDYRVKPKEDTAIRLSKIVKEFSNMPTGYFEAKPQRAVLNNEIAKVILPADANEELFDLLKSNNIPYETYTSGNEEERQSILDSSNEIKFSVKVDSEGNNLSEQQMEYFKDSVVRDDNGQLLVMYHGTPNATFTIFKAGTYFTANKDYADKYQSPTASSISTKRTVNNPDTYKVYLNITKPFDTRLPEVRKIWNEQYYHKWDTGELTDKGILDWTAVEGVRDFIEENELDFDGIIADEGSTGGYGEEVNYRGLSYIVMDSSQVKSVDNTAPTSDPDIRYSVKVDSDKQIINKLTGQEISTEAYDILDRLNRNIDVSMAEINDLPEIKYAREKLIEIIKDFKDKYPEFKNIPNADIHSLLLNTEERLKLREKIIDSRVNSGSLSGFDENGKEVYNGSVNKGYQLDIVLGLPASGKSSSIVNPLSEFYKSQVIDSDIVKEQLPEFNNGWGAGLVHEESSILNMSILEECLKRGNNIVLPIVGSKYNKVLRYIEIAKELNYSVRIHYNELPKNKSLARLINRFFKDGRFLDPELIFKAGDNIENVYEEIKKGGYVDEYSRWNNDVERGKRPIITDKSRGIGVYTQYSRSYRQNGRQNAGRNVSTNKEGEKGKDLERKNEIDTARYSVKIPDYDFSRTVAFHGTDEEIEAAEKREQEITDMFKNIIEQPDFKALRYKVNYGQNQYHLLHHSTRPEVDYQLSVYDDKGGIMHSNYYKTNMDKLYRDLTTEVLFLKDRNLEILPEDIETRKFSVKVDDDLALFKSIIAENEEFKEASNVITNTVKNIDNLKIKEADIKKIASGIKAEYKTNASVQDITDTLTQVFNYMNQDNVDYDSLVQIMSEVSKPMLENVTDTSTTRSESWDKFSSYLRNTKIKLSYGQIREVTSIYGSTENYRKKLFGVTTISREATMTLDEMWSELVDASGNLLPAYVADTDQPSVLLETIDSLRPQNIVSETYKMNLEQASFDLALEIYRRFFEAQAESNKSAELREAIGKLRTDQVVARRKAIEEYKRKLEEQKKLLEAEKQKNIKALAKELKDSEEKLIKAVEEHDQVSAALIESMKKKNERKIAQLKLQNNRKLAEVKSKNFDQRKAERDRRRSTILKEELRSQVNSINKMLKSPNISNYIKTTLVRQTIDVLESIDLDTGRSKNMSIKLMQLHDLYERYKGDETFSFDYDEATSKIIDNLRQTFENRNYTELSNKELTDVIDMVKRVKRQIQNAGKLLNEEKFKDARDAAQKAVTEIRQSRGTTNKFTEMLDDYMGYQLNAYRWFRKASGYDDNGALMQMYNSLDEGQMKMINMQKEVNSMFANVLEGEENQKNVRKIQSVEEKDLVNINLNKKGTPVMATREMMLSVLLHCQNADNARHIVLNGFRVPDLELYKKGKLEKAYEKGELKKFFTYEDISSIRDSLKQNNKDATFDDAVNWLIKWMQARAEKYRKENLSEWEEQYLQTAENLFHNYLGAKVNEVSQQTRGYALAKVVNYFPIHTDSDFTRTEFAALKNDGTLEGMGFLKERVKASNPIYLESLSNVIMKQTNDTSRYYGFSIPVRNINMIMGISLRNGEQLDSVRYAVTKVWGKTYLKIFQNILQDIQTGRGSDEGLAQTFTTMRGNFAAATLTANIGVGIKQASSFPTAAAVLGKEPLIKAFKDIPKGITAKGIPELEEINPLLWYRSKGQSSADINYATQSDVYKWLDKNHPKLKALSVDLIQNIDSATVRTLEYASMYYVDMNFKELEKGSDKYWAKVSEVFTKVVEETQPNYTVLQRPEILKDKNALVRQLFMFKTQPMQNLGILYDALGEYLNVKKHYKKDDKVYKDAAEKLGRAIWSQLIAAATFSAQTILSNLVYHKLYKYDQDDDKSMIEEMALAFVTGITSTLSGILLGGDWLYSAIMEWIFDQKNYGIEVSVVEMINDVFSTVTNMIKYTGKLADAKTEAERETAVKNIAKNTDSAAVLVGEFFGIPVNNVINSIGAILLPIKDLYTGAAWGESKFIWDESSDSQYLRMYDALLSNDSERYNKLYDEQKDKLSSDNAKKENPNPDYDPTDTINKKIKSMIKEAYTEKEITSDQAVNYLDRAGISYNDDIIDEWDYKNETGAKSYSKYSRLNDAIKNSYENKADRSAINTEIKKLLKNGTDKSDIASTITRNYKSIYLNNKSADLKNLLISCYMSCGYTREEALKRINDWK